MSKYTKERVEKICELISSGDYTIEEICQNVDISKETFYNWKHEKPDFFDAIKKADNERLKLYVKEARNSLLKKIKGYEFTETHTIEKTDKDGLYTETREVKKHIPPSDTLIMYTLNNQDPENFSYKEKREHEHVFKSFEIRPASEEKSSNK